VKYGFMRAHQDQFAVVRMCSVLEVSRSGYYSWQNRKESDRSAQNRAVLVEIHKVHEQSRQAYGAVKTWRELKAQEIKCGRHRVARLRRQAGIEACRKRRFRITTQSRAGIVAAENRLNQGDPFSILRNSSADKASFGDSARISHSAPRCKQTDQGVHREPSAPRISLNKSLAAKP